MDHMLENVVPNYNIVMLVVRKGMTFTSPNHVHKLSSDKIIFYGFDLQLVFHFCRPNWKFPLALTHLCPIIRSIYATPTPSLVSLCIGL